MWIAWLADEQIECKLVFDEDVRETCHACHHHIWPASSDGSRGGARQFILLTSLRLWMRSPFDGHSSPSHTVTMAEVLLPPFAAGRLDASSLNEAAHGRPLQVPSSR